MNLPPPSGHLEIVRQLLDGVDINHRDASGMTALSIASSKGFVKMVRLLLDAGADPDIKD